MNRRNFLKFGGVFSATATTGGIAALAKSVEQKSNPLPKFTSGSILTTESMNAMIERINKLESRIS